jgi:hypothetical protein
VDVAKQPTEGELTMTIDEIEKRLTRLDAQSQITRSLLFAIADTYPDPKRLRSTFEERAEGLMLLWRMRPEELSEGWMEAAENARLAIEHALADKTPGAPPGRGPGH